MEVKIISDDIDVVHTVIVSCDVLQRVTQHFTVYAKSPEEAMKMLTTANKGNYLSNTIHEKMNQNGSYDFESNDCNNVEISINNAPFAIKNPGVKTLETTPSTMESFIEKSSTLPIAENTNSYLFNSEDYIDEEVRRRRE